MSITAEFKNPIASKVRSGKSLVLYELVPPSGEESPNEIERSVSLIVDLCKKLAIDGINIPHVVDESRNGERIIQMNEKIEPAVLSKYLFAAGFHDVIINRPIVLQPWEKQLEWLEASYQSSLYNYIFVGGESSKVSYPGVSVGKAAELVTGDLSSRFPEICLGGITIPSRMNEAGRLLKKSIAGIDFFTSQIIYESESIKQVLKEYWELCRKNNIKPKTICLSFAPVTTLKDIELLKWLGVVIPENINSTLTTGWLGMGWRALNICRLILKDIYDFQKKENIRVPLGLNVSYINRHNFEFSISFMEQLSFDYIKYHKILNNL